MLCQQGGLKRPELAAAAATAAVAVAAALLSRMLLPCGTRVVVLEGGIVLLLVFLGLLRQQILLRGGVGKGAEAEQGHPHLIKGLEKGLLVGVDGSSGLEDGGGCYDPRMGAGAKLNEVMG
eukprot:scaffold70550_cov15-Tisochrysis_lutea.AAC.1